MLKMINSVTPKFLFRNNCFQKTLSLRADLFVKMGYWQVEVVLYKLLKEIFSLTLPKN